MGYRNYIGFIPKEEYDKIKSFTEEELYNYKGEKWSEDYNERGYVGPYKIVKELYEFGKYCEFDTTVQKQFFENEKLHKSYNSDGEFFIVGKEFLPKIIDQYKESVKKYYNDMVMPFFGDKDKPSEFLNSIKSTFDNTYDNNHTFDFSKITQVEQNALFKMFEHIRSFRIEWTHMTPYDLERGSEITTSWKYEYGIFELVRIYKSFDWENDIMVYYGW